MKNQQEIKPDEIIECDYGKILIYAGEKYYTGGLTDEGVVFKDRTIYEKQPDEICYISEDALEEYGEVFGENGLLKFANLNYDIPRGYSHNDFLKLCNGKEDMAREVFEAVDWQSPETYYEEKLEDDEISWDDR